MDVLVVRRESVHLSLEDQGFVTGIARDAAAVALLKKEINDLNGTSAKVPASLGGAEREIGKTGKTANSTGPEIDKLSGRLTLLRDVGVTIGPALLPIGAAVVPLLAGLTVGLGATVGVAGTAALAFNGLGDALKALNDYELEKTPENLAEVNRQLKLIGPAGSEFIQFIDSLEPGLRRMQRLARAGLLPGVEQGIKNLVDLLPDAKILVSDFATTLGKIAEDAGADLAGNDWEQFIEYLKTDAAPTFDALARSLGNFAQGFANIIVGLAPATRDFSGGLLELSQRFADWSSDLENSDGFRGFAAYVQESGPQVVELLGATAQAIGGIAKAAAPLGSAVLPVMTELARILGAIANSPFGSTFYTAIAGLIAYNRVAAIATRLTATMNTNIEKTGFATKGLSTGAKLTGLIAALYAVNQLAQQINKGLNETDLTRNLEAYANGLNVDDFDKIGSRIASVSSSLNKTLEVGDEAASLFGVLGDTNLDTATKDVESLDQALATMVESGNADQAAAAFERLIKAAEDKGVDGAEARRQFDAYNTALDNVAASSDKATAATSKVIGPTREYADSIANARLELQKEAQANRDAIQAMRDHKDALLANFDAETQYRQALKDARTQADTNSEGLKGNSDAVLANRSALSGLASAWNNQSAAVRNNNGRFKEARRAFIETAEAMGVPEAAAKRLANQVLAIPKSRVIKVEAEVVTAETAISRIKAMLNTIPKTLRTTYYVNQVNSISRPKAPTPGSLPGSADGTTVPKTGKGYADRHLYLLADGEEVVSNRHGQADRNRPLLKAINANRMAEGGTTGSWSHPTGSWPTTGSWPNEVGEWSHNTAAGLKGLQAALKKSETALDRQRAKVDAVRDKMSDLSNSVQQGLRSDIFAPKDPSANPWMAGATQGGPATYGSTIKDLRNDIKQGKEFTRLVRTLKGKGLDGPALAELIGSGDIDRARLYASLSAKDLNAYEKLYEQRQQVLAQAGNASGNAAFGSALATQQKALQDQLKETKGLRRDVKHLEAEIKREHKHDRDHSTKTAKTPAANARRRAVTG